MIAIVCICVCVYSYWYIYRVNCFTHIFYKTWLCFKTYVLLEKSESFKFCLALLYEHRFLYFSISLALCSLSYWIFFLFFPSCFCTTYIHVLSELSISFTQLNVNLKAFCLFVFPPWFIAVDSIFLVWFFFFLFSFSLSSSWWLSLSSTPTSF